jgi:ABC-2 type transport system permease protein
MFAILYVVFGMLVRLGTIEHYPVYLLLGIVLWTFFAEATNQGLTSIVERGDLLRKISFPKYIVVIATTISALINLLINLVVVAVFMFFNGVELQASAVLFPLYLLEIYSIALALAFLLSALNVKYRDVSHIWEIIMQAAFYATPIIYPLSVVVDKSMFAAKLLMLSPVAQAIQDARYALVTHQSLTISSLYGKAAYALIPLSIIVILTVAAIIYFKKSQAYFAENI